MELFSHRNSNAAAAKSLQSCPTLCDPIDGSPPGSPIPGLLQARTLEQVAILFSRDLPNPGIEPMSPALAGGFFTTEPSGKPSMHVYSAQINFKTMNSLRKETIIESSLYSS